MAPATMGESLSGWREGARPGVPGSTSPAGPWQVDEDPLLGFRGDDGGPLREAKPTREPRGDDRGGPLADAPGDGWFKVEPICPFNSGVVACSTGRSMVQLEPFRDRGNTPRPQPNERQEGTGGAGRDRRRSAPRAQGRSRKRRLFELLNEHPQRAPAARTARRSEPDSTSTPIALRNRRLCAGAPVFRRVNNG